MLKGFSVMVGFLIARSDNAADNLGGDRSNEKTALSFSPAAA